MRILPLSCPALIAVSVALSGCGGGGGGALGTMNGPLVTYGLQDRTADAVSPIGGHRLVSNSTAIRAISATLDHKTGNLTGFTDGVTTFSDTTGDENGVWTDGTTTAAPSTSLTGSYTYAGLYNITTPDGSGPAIVGVTTPSNAIPATGSATFTGSGYVVGTTLAAGQFLIPANSTVSVGFDPNAAASVTLTSLTGTAPFDTLKINGMSLNPANSTISGGDIMLLSGGTDVTATALGTGQTSEAAGTLFGIKSGVVAPAEIGGVFRATGNDGHLFGGFIGN